MTPDYILVSDNSQKFVTLQSIFICILICILVCIFCFLSALLKKDIWPKYLPLANQSYIVRLFPRPLEYSK